MLTIPFAVWCMYFATSNAHKCFLSLFLGGILNRLKPIDIVVLKKLTEVVNVVPVIAKSDSLTIEERIAFKNRVCFRAKGRLTQQRSYLQRYRF